MTEMLKQFVVFCGVGAVNTAFGLGIILVLSEIFGVQYLLANFLGYMAGLGLSYILHKTITFKDTSATAQLGRQAFRFLGVFAVAYVIQALILHLVVGGWGWRNIAGQVLACGVYLGISFAGNKLLTFRLTSS